MARAIDNVVIKGFSGSVGKQITFYQRAGKTIVGKARRKSAVAPSEKAIAVRTRFSASIGYAKIAMKDPATKSLYKAVAAPDQSAFNLAFRDAFLVPKVDSIDASNYHGQAGERITIQASDDFKVTGVTVSIHDPSGKLIEEGSASIDPNGADWVFVSTQNLATITGSKITGRAKDMPGNSGSMEIVLD
jgi:hypothetical protein